ncbi:MAG: murein L,D-transpeptidase catalytic domain-containing protein [Sphingomonas sp.]
MAIPSHDRIAIADFDIPSAEPRFHIINLGTGACESMLVAHGSGSDPEHTGLLQRFSNDISSKATSEGAFVTATIIRASTAPRSGWSGSIRPTTTRSIARSSSTAPGIRTPT